MYSDDFILYLIGSLIGGVIWGLIAQKIYNNKGYDDYSGFWWGFWLSIIGLIVVACKPENYISNYNIYNGSSVYAQEEEKKRLLADDNWKCNNCGQVNPRYLTTCTCGTSKSNNEPVSRPIVRPENTLKKTSMTADELLKLKQLLDAGVLTQEEFDKMKKQLLGL
ncbi:MAG: SHOCT domain-containing protein [Ruminococcus sp.]|nr:SHOCT domain-containing protein [Ruminococcus sp.]